MGIWNSMRFEEVTELFKRKRAIEILLLLENSDEVNFKDIDSRIESSSDTISNTLAKLADYGLVTRNQYNVNDVRYQLTDDGKETLDIIRELDTLIQQNKEVSDK